MSLSDTGFVPLTCRSFSRADEYLYAMKEDLAEWLNILVTMP
jgi:hypothetical protein